MLYEDQILDPIIARNEQKLKELEVGTPEYSRAMKDLCDLLEARDKRRNDEDARIEREHDRYVASKKEVADREREERLEKRRKKTESIDNGVKIGTLVMTGVNTVGTLLVFTCFTIMGFKFEETGHISSKVFSNVINKLGPKRN